MKHVSILSSFGACVSFAYAAPANAPQAPTLSISTQCTNAEIRQNWLVAECLTGGDLTTRIKSAVFLPNKVENDNGDLKWKADGEYRRSCQDCSIGDGATLKCSCKPAWGSGKTGMQPGVLQLDQHIGVYNGHLLSNLTSAPNVPSSPSKYPIPSSFSYSFGGNTTCPGVDGDGSDFCNKQFHSCTTTNDRNDTTNSSWFLDGPLSCFVPVIYFPQYHYQFVQLKLAGEGAWEILGYGDESCSGEPVGTIKPEDAGICKSFETTVKAVTVRPAFNGDPR